LGTYDCDDHACFVLSAGEQGGHQKDDYCNGDCSDCEVEFRVIAVDDYDEELDCEAEKEEKIEFKKGDIDLQGSNQ